MLYEPMRRFLASLLLLVIAALGTGVLEYVHALQHEREDAAEIATAIAAGHAAVPHPDHDDNNCPVHAQLHALVIITGWALLLVCIGKSICFAPFEPLALLAAGVTARPSCRDPPLALN